MKELPFSVRQTTDLEKWRVETFWDKEVETVAWIDSFFSGESLLDVGANIGLYSLYAASRGCRVLALEPHPGNFAALALNAKFNKHCRIVALNWAVGASDRLGEFRYTNIEAGASDGGCQKEGSKSDLVGINTIDKIDELRGPFDHIKIDVDGEEDLVIKGMKRCLEEQTFRSCLIEVAPENAELVWSAFQGNGYHADSPLNFLPNHSRNRRRAEGINVENIIFCRS